MIPALPTLSELRSVVPSYVSLDTLIVTEPLREVTDRDFLDDGKRFDWSHLVYYKTGEGVQIFCVFSRKRGKWWVDSMVSWGGLVS